MSTKCQSVFWALRICSEENEESCFPYGPNIIVWSKYRNTFLKYDFPHNKRYKYL